MPRPHLLAVTLLSLTTGLTGCRVHLMSDEGAKAFGSKLESGLTALANAAQQTQNLRLVVQSFFRKHQRWPATQAELQQFVDGSDGYLSIGSYQEIRLSPLEEGLLGVDAVSGGQRQSFIVAKPVPK